MNSRSVIYKLLAFTFAMVVFPISSYFLTVNTIFKGISNSPLLEMKPIRRFLVRRFSNDLMLIIP